MSKIREKFEYDELTGESVLIQTYDVEPVLDSVKLLREAPPQPMSDSKFVGRVPFSVAQEWCREAGVSFKDYDAVLEVIHRKLLSGDFQKLRVWEGTYKWDA